MLNNISIKNYKSIENLNIPLGRINVLIGENGAGKSNILEAIALAGAASARKLDNEFLSSRGVRLTQAELMRSAFSGYDDLSPIEITVESENSSKVSFRLTNDNKPYSSWKCEDKFTERNGDPIATDLQQWLKEYAVSSFGKEKKISDLIDFLIVAGKHGLPSNENNQISIESLKKYFSEDEAKENEVLKTLFNDSGKVNEIKPYLNNFIVFSPENSSLRIFEKEGQIEPLGINGEGLLKLIGVINNQQDQGDINKIKKDLGLLNWFNDFTISELGDELSMLVVDRFLDANRSSFDQKSANEGFLFLAFYLALFNAPITPDFFAVDNIDASLNPKLCRKLIELLAKAAKENHKQAILTTHNPAVLDGIDIFNNEHRLFVVERNDKGRTECRRILPPKGMTRKKWEETYFGMRLSEIWLSGAIGGLPTGF